MAITETLARRQKYWSELDDKQKTERTREVVQHLQCDVRRLQRLVERMVRHQHGDGGKILIDILEGTAPEERISRRCIDKPDETYF